jgi:hypothetical protein
MYIKHTSYFIAAKKGSWTSQGAAALNMRAAPIPWVARETSRISTSRQMPQPGGLAAVLETEVRDANLWRPRLSGKTSL